MCMGHRAVHSSCSMTTVPSGYVFPRTCCTDWKVACCCSSCATLSRASASSFSRADRWAPRVAASPCAAASWSCSCVPERSSSAQRASSSRQLQQRRDGMLGVVPRRNTVLSRCPAAGQQDRCHGNSHAFLVHCPHSSPLLCCLALLLVCGTLLHKAAQLLLKHLELLRGLLQMDGGDGARRWPSKHAGASHAHPRV